MYKLNKQERTFRERMRGRYPAGPRWYGVMTRAGREPQVRERVFFEFADPPVERILLPEVTANARRRTGKRRRPDLLFSSYVFLRCRMNDGLYTTISAYEDVFQILGRAYRIPSVIDDAEMAYLQGVLASDPRPKVVTRSSVGAEVEVTGGLMAGMQGRVIECNAGYVKIETCFSFLDDATGIVVAVPRSHVRLHETARPVPRGTLRPGKSRWSEGNHDSWVFHRWQR